MSCTRDTQKKNQRLKRDFLRDHETQRDDPRVEGHPDRSQAGPGDGPGASGNCVDLDRRAGTAG